MVKKLAIIREIFEGDHNAAAAVAVKLTRNQINALQRCLINDMVTGNMTQRDAKRNTES